MTVKQGDKELQCFAVFFPLSQDSLLLFCFSTTFSIHLRPVRAHKTLISLFKQYGCPLDTERVGEVRGQQISWSGKSNRMWGRVRRHFSTQRFSPVKVSDSVTTSSSSSDSMQCLLLFAILHNEIQITVSIPFARYAWKTKNVHFAEPRASESLMEKSDDNVAIKVNVPFNSPSCDFSFSLFDSFDETWWQNCLYDDVNQHRSHLAMQHWTAAASWVLLSG